MTWTRFTTALVIVGLGIALVRPARGQLTPDWSRQQAFTYTFTSTVGCPVLPCLIIFNTAGSGKVVRLLGIHMATQPTGVNAGVQVVYTLTHISTAGVDCVTLPVNALDSTNPSVTGVTFSRGNCVTANPTQVFRYGGCSLLNEESATKAPPFWCFDYKVKGQTPIILRPGEGAMLHNLFSSESGFVRKTMMVEIR